jgi:hypothetical protein
MNRSFPVLLCLVVPGVAAPALAQTNISPSHKYCWGENVGWMDWADAGSPAGAQAVHVGATFLSGFVWCENVGWMNVGNVAPTNGVSYANATGADFGVNVDGAGNLGGLAWGENVGWINFSAGAMASPAQPARVDHAQARLTGYAWGENVGWINLSDATNFVGITGLCGSADFNCDGAIGTDADIEAFFACIAGSCPPPPCASTADFNGDGAIGTDADIEAFFRVLAGGPC